MKRNTQIWSDGNALAKLNSREKIIQKFVNLYFTFVKAYLKKQNMKI